MGYINITPGDMRVPNNNRVYSITEERKRKIAETVEGWLRSVYSNKKDHLTIFDEDFPNKMELEWAVNQLIENGFKVKEEHITYPDYGGDSVSYIVTW
jgi:hypothetical protein